MRKKRLLYNTMAALSFQITTLICGFILPRLILKRFGSETNGLVNSVSQFLNVIAFLELGVGSVVQAALYKPLAEKDNNEISKIVSSAGKFFKRLACILLVYVIFLVVAYPSIVRTDYPRMSTAFLIIAMSISYFAQYYFGAVNRLLLNASQLGYINYTAQAISLIANTVICAFLIQLGFSIQIIKLTTSLIFLVRPLVLKIYVDRHYRINRKIQYQGEPIKQKWNGLAQHIAAIVLDGTDNIVLTIFSTLENVSIYGVYHLVVYGVRQIFVYMVSGVQALLGEMWAKKETDALNRFFGNFEWIVHTGTTFLFACTAALIIPFVRIYTSGISDAEYVQPLFGFLLTAAEAFYCLRIPYNNMILAAGHFKETQRCYIIATVINLVVSVATVIRFGLIGVAIGTLVAMAYQTIWMAYYNSKKMLKWSLKTSAKQLLVDVAEVFAIMLFSRMFELKQPTYLNWILLAIKIACGAVICMAVINFAMYREYVSAYINKFISLTNRLIHSGKKSKR